MVDVLLAFGERIVITQDGRTSLRECLFRACELVA